MNHAQMNPGLAALLQEVVGPDGRFGHRQHVHLAFLAARQHGPEPADAVMCDWIRQIAVSHGAASKYHATITIAWARVVEHHVAADPSVADFTAFAELYPALLDKTLLARHYTPALLSSPEARSGWMPPDLVPFPWAC